MFPEAPGAEVYRNYRRWAFESAALDLALRQAGRSLAEVVGREPRPVTFVVSMRLGEPASTAPVRRWLDLYPALRFKLDPTSSWGDELIAELAATGAVDSVDLKGFYKGTPVDQHADPALYARVAEGLPDAWIEDPELTEETDRVLEPHRDRFTWDAPIHSPADIEALPFPPRTINMKPSRFGPVSTLFETYDFCAERGIGSLRGRPVRARAGPRAAPVPRLDLPSGRPERHRSERIQRPRARRRSPHEPARAGRRPDRVSLAGLLRDYSLNL